MTNLFETLGRHHINKIRIKNIAKVLPIFERNFPMILHNAILTSPTMWYADNQFSHVS